MQVDDIFSANLTANFYKVLKIDGKYFFELSLTSGEQGSVDNQVMLDLIPSNFQRQLSTYSCNVSRMRKVTDSKMFPGRKMRARMSRQQEKLTVKKS